MHMELKKIIGELGDRRNELDRVIAALTPLTSRTADEPMKRPPGRPRKTAAVIPLPILTRDELKRKRLSRALKKYWREKRAAGVEGKALGPRRRY